MQKQLKLPIMALFIIITLASVFSVFALFNVQNISPSLAVIEQSSWNGELCVIVQDVNGNIKQQSCDHNVLTYPGMNATRDLIRNGGNFFRNVSFANCSASCGVPAITPTSSYTAFAGCGLLSDTTGTSTAINPSTNGNFSITGTYTSTCENVVSNLTRLLNASGTIIAEASVSNFNLSTDDTVSYNWTISIV